MSKKALFNELAKHFDDPAIINNAEKVLEYVTSPKIARELPDGAREQYKQALDMVQGPIEKRAAEVMPEISFEDLVAAHNKQDKKMKDVSFPFKIDAFESVGQYGNPKLNVEMIKIDDPFRSIVDLDLSKHPLLDGYKFRAYNVHTKSPYRKQGLASEMYRKAEKILGEPISPSHNRLKDGVELWKHGGKTRPFGNKRHPEAAFDIRFKDSNDILAGAAPFVVAGSLMAQSQKEQCQKKKKLMLVLRPQKKLVMAQRRALKTLPRCFEKAQSLFLMLLVLHTLSTTKHSIKLLRL
jgi:ribosomal protein S18 acetylase RimI-like enzyme